MTDTDPRQALLDALPMPAVLIGGDERLTHANAAAVGLLGSAFQGRHYITAFRQPDLIEAIEATRQDGKRRSARWLTRVRGADATWEVSVARVGEGESGGILLVFHDVSQGEIARQMRRDFVANVSHELKTPLTTLSGLIETLRGPAREDAEARDRFLAMMATEAERMARLVGDLLALNRVETAERVRPAETVDLVGLVEGAAERLAPLAGEKGADLRLELPEEPLPVRADAEQLAQVVSNLLENALRYGGAGVRVTVRLAFEPHAPELRAPAARLEVADTGPGVDPVHVPRLTERFYRVDSHRSRELGGTGLGLAIVKHIVSRHRGRLRIESAPGQGMTVTVLLPMDV